MPMTKGRWKKNNGLIHVADGFLSTRLARRLCVRCCTNCRGMRHHPNLIWAAYCALTPSMVHEKGITERKLIGIPGIGVGCLLEFRAWMAKAGYHDIEVGYKQLLKSPARYARLDEGAQHGRALASGTPATPPT